MAHSYYHSLSSVRKFGGKIHNYLPLHNWFDATKSITANFVHRALRHHTEGIDLSKQLFGEYIKHSNGHDISLMEVSKLHLQEDFCSCPDASAWYKLIELKSWRRELF